MIQQEYLMAPKHLQNMQVVPTKYMHSEVLDIYLALFTWCLLDSWVYIVCIAQP